MKQGWERDVVNLGLVETRKFHSRAMPVGREAPRAIRAWRVVHACDSIHQVLPVVEAQAAAGIKPYVLTSQGECLDQSGFRARQMEGSKPVSLLKAWSEVRNWRRNFLNSEVEAGVPATDADLVHAHCFSAGMAAVRNSRAAVYSLYDFIENLPHGHGQKDHSWLVRSFAVAEQFVLTRAGAVVVHRRGLWEELLRRGCAAENVFLIPEPLSAEVIDFLLEPQSVLSAKRKRDDSVVFFAPDICVEGAGGCVATGNGGQEETSFASAANESAGRPCGRGAQLKLAKNADCLLEAFAIVRREIRRARLLVVATPACASLLLEKSIAMGIADAIFAISSAECGRAFAEADVIIALGNAAARGDARDAEREISAATPTAGGTHQPLECLSEEHFPVEQVSAARSRAGHLSAALTGMIVGVTVLAADTPGHRDLSPEGRGLLWFRPEDARDLATRAAFLAHNPELCRSLAVAARKHLMETRSPQAIGCRYNEVYHHVFVRRRSNRATPPAGGLELLTASL
jgi:glycosyltransferase involved in cell wall biosynthesis